MAVIYDPTTGQSTYGPTFGSPPQTGGSSSTSGYPQYGTTQYNTSITQGGIPGAGTLNNLPDNPQLNVSQILHNYPGMLNRVTPEQMREMNSQNVDSYRTNVGQQSIPASQQMQSTNLGQMFSQMSAAQNASNGYLNALNGIASNQRGNEVALNNAQQTIGNNRAQQFGGSLLGNIFGGGGLFGGF